MSATASGGTRRVVRNSTALAVAGILERAAGFVVALLIADALGPKGLGIYAAAWAIFGLVVIAGDAGAKDYLVREISREPARTATYTVHLGIVSLVAATVLMLVAQVVIPHLNYSAELQASGAVILFAVLPRIMNVIQEAVFVAHGRVAFQTLTRLVMSSVYVIATAWLLRQGRGVPAVLTALLAVECAVAVIYFVLISRFIARLRLRFDWSLALRLIRGIKWFAASSALAALFARPEILILSLLATERQVGLYSAALRLAELPLLLPEVFMTNTFPLLSQAFKTAEDRFAAWQGASVRLVLAFSLPVAACFLSAADQIIRLPYGEDFGQSAVILRILAGNVVLFSLIAVAWRVLVARDQQRTNVAVQSVMVAVRLGGGALLITSLAAIGAAIASVVTASVHLTMLLGATKRSGAPTRIGRTGWRFAVAAVVTGLTVWVLGHWLPVLLTVPIGLLCYLPTLLLIGAVTPEDRLVLRRLRKSRARP